VYGDTRKLVSEKFGMVSNQARPYVIILRSLALGIVRRRRRWYARGYPPPFSDVVLKGTVLWFEGRRLDVAFEFDGLSPFDLFVEVFLIVHCL